MAFSSEISQKINKKMVFESKNILSFLKKNTRKTNRKSYCSRYRFRNLRLKNTIIDKILMANKYDFLNL